ncbi:M48 family metallopeptidase [Pseudalkalibacillus caeni]|uniref:Peptidase M48 domain-containing protein n=1 Tax=Exobacillus caeni TaxID=2574798 RepID=A0A5R9F5P9_9BACL|nr:M48 family metallopeptidase [Pseudalkalibacillus caeni]TLS35804.1 hypothetical protein FCL54_18485 [Pseudalkalibacillus caeni]
MDFNRLEDKIKKLEAYADKNPGAYRFRVGLLAFLGYFYVLFILAAALFLLGISIFYIIDSGFSFGSAKVVLITGSLSFILFRALWVKQFEPEGYELSREEAPSLFEMVDKLTKELHTATIHKIVLESRYNAAMAQVPRLGVLGFHKNILILGFPLLLTLSKEQVTSVIAHELGHLRGKDSKFSGWIYRVRESWFRTIESFQEDDFYYKVLFKKFFNWYLPQLDAYSFILMRREEYLADAAAARVTSSKITAETLCDIQIKAPYFYENYWNEIYDQAKQHNTSPKPYLHLTASINKIPEQYHKDYLNLALKDKTGYGDTHPCLRDRLASLGEKVQTSAKLEKSAAEEFFAKPDEIVDAFDVDWWETAKEDIEARFEYEKDAKVRYEKLQGKALLTVDEKIEKANITRNLEELEKAMPLYEELLPEKEANENPVFLYAIGTAYLELENSKGVEYLRKCISMDWELKLDSLEAVGDFYYKHNLEEDLESIVQEREEWIAVLEASAEESEIVTEEDEFEGCNIDQKVVLELVEGLKEISQIEEAFLVQKKLSTIPDKPCHILGFKLEPNDSVKPEKYWQEIFEECDEKLAVPFNTTFTVLLPDEVVTEKITSIKSAQIYQKQVLAEKLS